MEDGQSIAHGPVVISSVELDRDQDTDSALIRSLNLVVTHALEVMRI